MKGDEKLAIILINFNNTSDTIACIDSVMKAEYTLWKIFLVDNGSDDKSVNTLKKYIENKISKIDFIEEPQNHGFAGANNIAIERALDEGYEYIWMLNNDTEIDKNAIEPMIEVLHKDETIGAVGSRIFYWGTDKIWFIGGYFDKKTGIVNIYGKNKQDSTEFDESIECDYITGCSLMTTKSVLEEVGLLRDDYFLYYEETDWCTRAKKKGFHMKYCPHSRVYHKVGGASDGYKAPYIAYYNLRNRFIFIRRNFNRFYSITAFIYLFIKASKLAINVFRLRKDRKKERLKAILLACIHSIIGKMGRY